MIRANSAAYGWRGPVLLVGDVISPDDGTAGLVGLLHRYVGHEAVRRGAVPVVLSGLEEHRVVGPDDLDLSAAALAEPHALGNVDGLPEGVGLCHAVRAPGVKWTLAAPRRDGSVGAATVSMKTVPVNDSPGPVAVWVLLFLVICTLSSLVVGKTAAVLSGGVSAPEAAMLCVRRSSFRATMLDDEHAAAATPRGSPGRTSQA